jgi:hypothetical protein
MKPAANSRADRTAVRVTDKKRLSKKTEPLMAFNPQGSGQMQPAAEDGRR